MHIGLLDKTTGGDADKIIHECMFSITVYQTALFTYCTWQGLFVQFGLLHNISSWVDLKLAFQELKWRVSRKTNCTKINETLRVHVTVANAIFLYSLWQLTTDFTWRKRFSVRARALQERSRSLQSREEVARPSATLPSREVLTVNVRDERKFQLNEMELSRRKNWKKR